MEKVKVEQTLSIDGVIVVQVGEVDGFKVFSPAQADSCDGVLTRYICTKNTLELVMKIDVEADCTQNFGYVSQFKINGVELS